MFHLPILPSRLQTVYQSIRILLYLSLFIGIALFALKLFFPTFSFKYNFRVSNSSNTLSAPYSEKRTPANNGKIISSGALITSASVSGTFSSLTAHLTLEKKSALPENFSVVIRRSYQSFFLPTGMPITSFPEETIYKIADTYYALKDNTLYLFVSPSAFLSRYTESMAHEENESFLTAHTLSEEFIGYRVGSLVSFADGVFIITSETDMRPIGNAETLLTLGYRFEDVLPASEEEIGIYKRGRIILLGAIHPDGTLLFDQDTNTYYLIDKGFKRPIEDSVYLNFLKEKQMPVLVSSFASAKQVSCALRPGLLGQSFSCDASIDTLTSGFGNDFILSIQDNDIDIELQTLDVSFKTKQSKDTILLTLSQIKQRLISRLGAL